MKLRCFVAIEVNEEIRSNVKKFWSDVKKSEVDVKFVEPKNLHFTLAFLGEVNPSTIDRLEKTLKEGLSTQSSFKVRLCGVKRHGNGDVRNVWVDVSEGKREFEGLAILVQKILMGEGFTIEEAKPHMTICRLRTQKNAKMLLQVIKDSSESCFGELIVDNIKLKKSELTSKGPVYSDLFTIRLR